MTKVKIHGELAKVLGKEDWKFQVQSVSEALRALESNTGRLYKHLIGNPQAEYRVIVNGSDHREFGELQIPRHIREIDLIPVPQGSGGLWQIIIGVVLIIAAVVLTIVAPEAAPGAFSLIHLGITALAGIGLSLTLGGIAQLIAPSPQLNPSLPTSRTSKSDPLQTGDTNQPSYLFGGTVNTISQGTCVPLGYGRMIVGSQLIGFGIFNFPLQEGVPFGEAVRDPTENPFELLSLWDTLQASLLFAPYIIRTDMTARTNQVSIAIATKFKIIRSGTNIPALATLRLYLHTVFFVFRGPRLANITKDRARTLYNRLNLDSGTKLFLNPDTMSYITYAQATQEQYILALGTYYLTII